MILAKSGMCRISIMDKELLVCRQVADPQTHWFPLLLSRLSNNGLRMILGQPFNLAEPLTTWSWSLSSTKQVPRHLAGDESYSTDHSILEWECEGLSWQGQARAVDNLEWVFWVLPGQIFHILCQWYFKHRILDWRNIYICIYIYMYISIYVHIMLYGQFYKYMTIYVRTLIVVRCSKKTILWATPASADTPKLQIVQGPDQSCPSGSPSLLWHLSGS